MGHHRPGVLRDEDDAVHVLPRQADAVDDVARHRVADENAASAETVHQPFRMERWDVRATAGAYDHASENIGIG